MFVMVFFQSSELMASKKISMIFDLFIHISLRFKNLKMPKQAKTFVETTNFYTRSQIY